MTKNIKKRIIKCGLVLTFLSVALAGNFLLENIILAQETSLSEINFLCEETEEINLRLLKPREKKELIENTSEIPIGRSTDYTEKMADDIIIWSQKILDNARAEIVLAEEILAESQGCEVGVCQSDCHKRTWDCSPYWGDGGCGDGHTCGLCTSTPPASYTAPTCCCHTCAECIDEPCKGDCADIAASIKGKVDGIKPLDAAIDTYHTKIERTYFEEFFYPLLLYNEQYGIYVNGGKVEEPTSSQIRNYLASYLEYIPAWLSAALNSMDSGPHRDWNGLSGWEEAARKICLEMEDYKNIYCITPSAWHTSVEKNEDGDPIPFTYGYLDKARIRMSECVSEPYLIEAVLRGEKAEYGFMGCRDLKDMDVIPHSFISKDGLDENGLPLEGVPTEGCYGYYYGQAMEAVGITPRYPAPNADDFYCCSF